MFPLLFALGMDYMNRIMRYIGDFEGYRYHVKCKNLKPTHLYFADDFLIFL